MELSLCFPHNGYQYSKHFIMKWNPKRIDRAVYTKKPFGSSTEDFKNQQTISITKEEFEQAKDEARH
jgi:hypothetical protein